MKKTTKLLYETPVITKREVIIENGFAQTEQTLTAGDDSSDEGPNDWVSGGTF